MIRQFIYGGTTQSFDFDNETIQIFHPQNVQQTYNDRLAQNTKEPFPFWAKIWPASKAIARYIQEFPELFYNKHVVEIAAGLALPSIAIAKFTRAHTIHATDYLPEILPYIQESAALNNTKITCSIYNWQNTPDFQQADIIILSDVNYSPEAFPYIWQLIHTFLDRKCTIILSTPQRITAVHFVEQITNYISHQKRYYIDETAISVMVLQ